MRVDKVLAYLKFLFLLIDKILIEINNITFFALVLLKNNLQYFSKRQLKILMKFASKFTFLREDFITCFYKHLTRAR